MSSYGKTGVDSTRASTISADWRLRREQGAVDVTTGGPALVTNCRDPIQDLNWATVRVETVLETTVFVIVTDGVIGFECDGRLMVKPPKNLRSGAKLFVRPCA